MPWTYCPSCASTRTLALTPAKLMTRLTCCLQRKLAQALPWTYPQSHAVPGLVLASLQSGNSSGSVPVNMTSVPISQWWPSDGAQPWDMDPSEIVICTRPDGSDWLLGEGSYGQVCNLKYSFVCSSSHSFFHPFVRAFVYSCIHYFTDMLFHVHACHVWLKGPARYSHQSLVLERSPLA